MSAAEISMSAQRDAVDACPATEDIRPRAYRARLSNRRIRFPPDHYRRPPEVAVGLTGLVASSKHPIRAGVIAEDITSKSFTIGIESESDTRLHWGSAAWIERKAKAKDCIFGSFDTEESSTPHLRSFLTYHDRSNATSRRPSLAVSTISALSAAEPPLSMTTTSPPPSPTTSISTSSSQTTLCDPFTSFQPTEKHQKKHCRQFTFSRPFDSPPVVICWLNRLDFPSSVDTNGNVCRYYRMRCFADEVTRTGFRAHLNSWGINKESSTLTVSGNLKPSQMTNAIEREQMMFAFTPQKSHTADEGTSGPSSPIKIETAVTSSTSGGMTWIAFPRSKRNVAYGQLETSAHRKRHAPWPRIAVRVYFKRPFIQPPAVVAALSLLDIDGGKSDLSVRLTVERVNCTGFTWVVEMWGEARGQVGGYRHEDEMSRGWNVGGMWIALGERA